MVAPIERISYSADGRLLASASQDRTARIWDVETLRSLAVLHHGSTVYAVAFSPDRRRLATGAADGIIRLWDVATGTQVADLRGHHSYVHALAFSPDGTRLASGSGDFTIRIWDSIPASERARTRTSLPPESPARSTGPRVENRADGQRASIPAVSPPPTSSRDGGGEKPFSPGEGEKVPRSGG
jgi:WD40 repeat protein